MAQWYNGPLLHLTPALNKKVLNKGPFTSENIHARFTFKIHFEVGEKYFLRSLYVGM